MMMMMMMMLSNVDLIFDDFCHQRRFLNHQWVLFFFSQEFIWEKKMTGKFGDFALNCCSKRSLSYWVEKEFAHKKLASGLNLVRTSVWCTMYVLSSTVRNVNVTLQQYSISFHFQMSLNIGKEKDDYHHKNEEDENDGISLSLSSATLLALKEFALQRGN